MPNARPDKPAAVSLNLDTLEREGAAKPFVVVIDGRPVQFLDAEEIDWRELIALMTNPTSFFDVAIEKKADRDHVAKARIPAWKLRKLVDAYMAHHGLELAKGEAPASSPR